MKIKKAEIKLRRYICFIAIVIICMCTAASAQNFKHPGGLHTQNDLDRMKAKVQAGEHPWIDGWKVLINDKKAQSSYKPSAHRHMGSRQRAQDDANAAYLNTLRWIISGKREHADCAVRILNTWAETVNEIPRGHDQPGLSGIPIGTFAIAAELLRLYPDWSVEDQGKFKNMLLEFFYPVCHDFLVHHNGRSDTTYWANWDTCNMRAIMAIGVFCDDRKKFDEAVEYFKNGRGMGSIRNIVPYRYPGGLGQWQESGRDQAHVMGGQGLLAEMCQIAWNQGLDLFAYDDNALLAGAEYTAQYTLWKGVPYTFYTNSNNANQHYISQNYHGRLDASHFELLYNHYVVRQGLKAPNVKLFAELRRPEPGEIDVLGYGTLTYTLDADASPISTELPRIPREVTAAPGLKRVELSWSPSGAYNIHGYEIKRAESPRGPYNTIYSTTRWTTPYYTDTGVEADKTYYYTVTALNNAGKSRPSAYVSATPAKGKSLPAAYLPVSAKDALYSKAAGNSFVVPGNDDNNNGSFVGKLTNGNFIITARLVDWYGPVGQMGLTIREQTPDKPHILTMTLGEIGGRQARFRTHNSDGKVDTQLGCDYTWLPVWFRLKRTGNNFTALQSSDGIEWFEIGKSTVSLPRNVLAGLFVKKGRTPPGRKSDDSPCGIFDNVTINRRMPARPHPPHKLTAANIKNGTVRLNWENTNTSSQAGIKVEASCEGKPFYEIANLSGDNTCFENTGIKTPSVFRYRIRAYNTSGYSDYSNIVSLSH